LASGVWRFFGTFGTPRRQTPDATFPKHKTPGARRQTPDAQRRQTPGARRHFLSILAPFGVGVWRLASGTWRLAPFGTFFGVWRLAPVEFFSIYSTTLYNHFFIFIQSASAIANPKSTRQPKSTRVTRHPDDLTTRFTRRVDPNPSCTTNPTIQSFRRHCPPVPSSIANPDPSHPTSR
jgi:hypothetical protein